MQLKFLKIVLTILFLLSTRYLIALGDFIGDDVTLRPHPHYQKITMEKHLKNHGVAMERHKILTEDGYLLTLFNFCQENCVFHQNRAPILLVHGLTTDCASWFIGDVKKTLPYLLLSNNNDIWCVNLRGTRSSRKHKWYSTYSRDYWNFSWHENGFYDLPPVVDYVTSYTKHRKLISVGHSSGFTSFLVLLSKRPEYNRKIDHIFGLGPPGAITESKNDAIAFTETIVPYIKWLGAILYMLPPPGTHELLSNVCSINFLTNFVCAQLISFYFGYNPEQFSYTTPGTLLSVIPLTVATKQLLHYASTHNLGEFNEYDYGRRRNMEVYGTPRPPNYNTSNVMVPITLMYGLGDWMVTPKNVKFTHSLLPRATLYQIPCGYFNHVDFVSGKYASICAHEKIIETINTKMAARIKNTQAQIDTVNVNFTSNAKFVN